MKKIWVATANPHKVEEIRQILGDDTEVCSLLDLPDFPAIEENGSSYEENAMIKAEALWKAVKEPVFSDDSGLEVEALNNYPGIHSSRFSGPDATHESNIDKLLLELDSAKTDNRSARFRCVIAYIDAEGNKHFFSGSLEGKITSSRSGSGGFGYDPVFFLPEYNCTVAEIPAHEKNKVSHRARAMTKLVAHLKNT